MEFDEYVVDLNADCKCGCRDLYRFHNIYHFPNDYGASAIANPKNGGFVDGGYRVMIVEFEDEDCYHLATPPGFDSNVVECADWNEVVGVLQRLKDLRFSKKNEAGPEAPRFPHCWWWAMLFSVSKKSALIV